MLNDVVLKLNGPVGSNLWIGPMDHTVAFWVCKTHNPIGPCWRAHILQLQHMGRVIRREKRSEVKRLDSFSVLIFRDGTLLLHLLGQHGPENMGTGEQHCLHGSSFNRFRLHLLLRRSRPGQVPAGEALGQRSPLLQARQDLCPSSTQDGRPRSLRWKHRGHGPYAGQDRRRRHYCHGRLCFAC